MSRPPIQSVKLSDHVTVSECHPDSECYANNWWLYDTRAGMNLAMRTATREGALIKAVEYWAKRCLKSESMHASLQTLVDNFVVTVSPERGDEG